MKLYGPSKLSLPLAGLLLGSSTANVLYNGPYKTVTATATVTQTSFTTAYTKAPAPTSGPGITAEDKTSQVYTESNKDYLLTVHYGYNKGIDKQRFQISGRICPGRSGSFELEEMLQKLGARTTPVEEGAEPGEVRLWDYRISGSADSDFDWSLLGPVIREASGCKLPLQLPEEPHTVVKEQWRKQTENAVIIVDHDGVHDQNITIKGKFIHGEKYRDGVGMQEAMERRGIYVLGLAKSMVNTEYSLTATAPPNFPYADLEQAVCDGGGCGWAPEGTGPWPMPHSEEGRRDYLRWMDMFNYEHMVDEDQWIPGEAVTLVDCTTSSDPNCR
ncbi:hypothetical protein BLS_005567 [Venturia inaequalis]|uniref:Uncharacterized protein n=1 Tax=Venturia inaequalis TaxID=5025 RepID=A0A8H3UHU4_VENIN|nr:hypothetical protein BLS_005567 [Venturia inaequalis]